MTSAVIGTSVSKMFAKSEGAFLYSLFALAIFFAAINVVSLIFAATTVNQGALQPRPEPSLTLMRPSSPELPHLPWPALSCPSSPAPSPPQPTRTR